MKKTKILAILNLVALCIQLGFSVIVQLKLINSNDVGEVSSRYQSLFTPAGYTFSIWGIIYIALTIMCLYHLVGAFKASPKAAVTNDITSMGYWFILNNLATSAWLLAFTGGQILLSEALIVFQLTSLIIIHIKLRIYQPAAAASEKFFTQMPLSIYLGWISVATIANTAVTLLQYKWDGWGASDTFWTSGMIAIGIVISLIMVFSKRNVWFGLVYIWALFGILSKLHELGTPPPAIISIIWSGIGLTGIAIIFQLLRFPVQHNKLQEMPGN